MKIWIPVAILVIVLMLFAGLIPLPGQKDNETLLTQPGTPQVEAPTGPAASPPAQVGAGATPPPPGGDPAPHPGMPAPKSAQ